MAGSSELLEVIANSCTVLSTVVAATLWLAERLRESQERKLQDDPEVVEQSSGGRKGTQNEESR